MQITNPSPEMFHVLLSKDEMGALINCISEVCHGFELPDFVAKIGAEKRVAEGLLEVIDAVYPREEVSWETGHFDRSEIVAEATALSEERFEINLPQNELNIIRNAIVETLHYLDEIDIHTRLGAWPVEVKALRDQMNEALNS